MAAKEPHKCGVWCWTGRQCPICDVEQMRPLGRDVLPGEPRCDIANCAARDYRKNIRHLWSQHDRERERTDQEGWQRHLIACQPCRDG